MKMIRLLVPFAFLAVVSCGSTEEQTIPAKQPTTAPPAQLGAEVLETMDAGGYTYLHLKDGDKQDWYAVPQCSIRTGDHVTVAAGAMPMKNFESPSLKRTFDLIYFAGSVKKVGGADANATADSTAGPAAAGPHGATAPKASGGTDAVAKPEGGMTVADIWAQGAAGAGKEVTFRGKVVKYNGGILGVNWLHVQDGSGSTNPNASGSRVLHILRRYAKSGDHSNLVGFLA
ncbi:MAG: hypothetical protein KDC98_13965, partial [Planctomycetes bacterium]|nr:hypothetical protein [Planctomycetota bacterium]